MSLLKNKSFERYSLRREKKILDKLKKLLVEERTCVSEKRAFNTFELCVLDASNVLMVIAITDRSKSLLRRFLQAGEDLPKVPSLSYCLSETDLVKAKFSVDYLKEAIDFFKSTEEEKDSLEVFLNVKSDYPITMSSVDWRIIIAPKVDND